jgi:hypothetical protein
MLWPAAPARRHLNVNAHRPTNTKITPQTKPPPPHKKQAAVLDEAHRLKSRTSATRLALDEMQVKWHLLLSGTPVQNSMRELQGLMSLLDEGARGDDCLLMMYND